MLFMTFGVLAEVDPPRPEVIKSHKKHKKHKRRDPWIQARTGPGLEEAAFYAFYDFL